MQDKNNFKQIPLKKNDKLLKIMKIYILITFLCIFSAVAENSFSQTESLTLKMTNVTLKDAIKQIERTTDYLFLIMDESENELTKTISIDLDNKSIEEILTHLLKDTQLSFSIVRRQITIRKNLSLSNATIKSPKTEEITQQTRRHIRGTITDARGEAVIGANIIEIGTNNGTVTDINGSFSLLTNFTSQIRISYIGYKDQIVNTSGRENFYITLEEDSQVLGEVTITALGIKRDRKAVGYSVGEVKGDDLQQAKDINVINSLSGKIPGLIIEQTAGGQTGTSKVVLRGYTELTGNNQPLYVLDGVPLDNTSFGSATLGGGFDLGDGISSINPDDIENISILKGPAAAALYGSRAGHGVILITTKKGTIKSKYIGVELNSSTTFDLQSTRQDDVQYIYGQGSDGRVNLLNNKSTYNKNWGTKINPDIDFLHFDNVKRPFIAIKDHIDGFFRTGFTTNNTITINNVNEKNAIRISFSDLRNNDIVPNTGMRRNTVTIRDNTKIGEKIDLDLKVSFINESVKNRPSLAGERTNIGRNMMTLATTVDQEWLKNSYEDNTGSYFDWNNRDNYNINPYWIIYKMKNESKKDRLLSSAIIRYDILPEINLQFTGGTDYNYFNFSDFAPPTTPGKETGFLQLRDFNNKTWNTELLVSYVKDFGDFDFSSRLGGNIFSVANNTTFTEAKDMAIKDKISLNSFTNIILEKGAYRKQINSAFGMLNIGYKNFLFVDATYRVDKSSSLTNPDGSLSQNVYGYPSLSGSLVFTDFLNINNTIIDWGKIRASWAKVGSDTDPYQLSLNYRLSNRIYPGYPVSYIGNSVRPNKELKPTITSSVELGFETRLLSNRIGIDFTYYDQISSNQIMSLPTSPTTGYSQTLINAGKIQNKGIEIILNTKPIQTSNLNWDLNLNFAQNINKVIELFNDENNTINSVELVPSPWGVATNVQAKVGERYAVIMGQDFMRSPSGEVIIDSENGFPKYNPDWIPFGYGTWDWTGGIYSRLAYKNLSLVTVIDIKFGAKLYSMTNRSNYFVGKSKNTLEGRDGWYNSEEARMRNGVSRTDWTPTGGLIINGVIEEVDANGKTTYRPNDIFINPGEYWTTVVDRTPSFNIYDNTYSKIRELILTYALPRRWYSSVAEDITVAFVARNPFILYKNVPNIDPESTFNGSWFGMEYGSLPTRRSFGLNVNIKF